MPTKHGVEYDLRKSPYRCSWGGFDFYFSSATHLDKFRRLVDRRVEWMNDSMSRRFHFNVEADVIAVFQLYMQVETRGFLVHYAVMDRWYVCPESITLRGTLIS